MSGDYWGGRWGNSWGSRWGIIGQLIVKIKREIVRGISYLKANVLGNSKIGRG